MNKLPITIGFFTSTKGHHNRKTDYKITLDNWNKQIPLVLFNLVAHIKVTPGEEAVGEDMKRDLESRGFKVIITVADWKRGLSHGAAYLGDMVKMSKSFLFTDSFRNHPYFLLLEDDSPVVCYKRSLENILLSSCDMLAGRIDLLTVRFMRRADNPCPVEDSKGVKSDNEDYFYSKNVDFQPVLMRAIDFYRAGMVFESNQEACQNVQCELLFRMVMDQFSRSYLKHIVWKPDFAETVHIGIPQPEHEAAIKKI